VMAKKKRLYIEIRGIMEAAEKSGGGFSASQSARIAELESAVASHGPEVERCERETWGPPRHFSPPPKRTANRLGDD
jgi:hypothetical protein